MPELPEVETTRRGLSPYIESHKITAVTIRNFKLRWPIADNLAAILSNQTIHKISRRAKYLLFQCNTGTLIIHLGMSGHLQIIDKRDPVGKHDHVDIQFENGLTLRYTDPRRFGAILWSEYEDIQQHPLLSHLGPEPLSETFTANYLLKISHDRRCSIKTFIMNGKNVVGIGNIYANEALFLARIHPKTPAGKLTKGQATLLVTVIKQVLKKAIDAGGTTLKDFRKSDGKPGYFSQQLHIYGKEGESCLHCGSQILQYKEGQRATFFCPQCQLI